MKERNFKASNDFVRNINIDSVISLRQLYCTCLISLVIVLHHLLFNHELVQHRIPFWWR